jgi:hypothetical protein
MARDPQFTQNFLSKEYLGLLKGEEIQLIDDFHRILANNPSLVRAYDYWTPVEYNETALLKPSFRLAIC